MAELGASTGKSGLIFWGIPVPTWAAPRLVQPGHRDIVGLLGKEVAANCPAMCLTAHLLSWTFFLLCCAMKIAGQQATNPMDCRPSWGAGICNHGDRQKCAGWQDLPLRD